MQFEGLSDLVVRDRCRRPGLCEPRGCLAHPTTSRRMHRRFNGPEQTQACPGAVMVALPVGSGSSLRVPINYPAWSSDMSVLVKGSAEAVSAVDVQVADVSWRADRLGFRAERSGVLQRSVRSMLVVEGLELAERV